MAVQSPARDRLSQIWYIFSFFSLWCVGANFVFMACFCVYCVALLLGGHVKPCAKFTYRKISNTIRTIFTKNRGPEAGVRIIHLN